ncbi:ABC transporter permease [Streptomyces sp. ICBB 8177]|uniref:ABC transporter permease n=1 Tax=Streptomyces sp. ICBB 8177 TaxID=563922 RepID=UPI000D67493C|nr:ABC transporter permease [Streptomyces sp. ICBB 8177]PWI44172.1 ABC transporter [Streptomyces sp. ICBB 8177]
MNRLVESPAAPVSPDAGLSPKEVAEKYGLSVSNARPPLPVYTRQLWQRRHFITSFATARLTAMYTTARLGQAWQVMTPLLNAAVYYLIFGVLLGTNRGTPNFIPYLCTGIFVFNFTQTAVLSGTRSVSDNLGLIRALHFPRACLPIAFTVIQLQQLIFSMGVLGTIVLVTGVPFTLNWLLVIPALILQSVFNAGLAMVMARIGAKTTDTAQLMPFILRTWMYLSGVFYNLSNYSSRFPHFVMHLLNANPALVYISLMRHALIDTVTPASLPPHVWAMALGWAVLVGFAGYVFFWKAEEEYGRG